MPNPVFANVRVLVRGGGDLGSGVVYRLHRAGFPVILAELPAPLFVRRAVAYGAAVYEGQITVENVTARLVPDLAAADECLRAGDVPVMVDANGALLSDLAPAVLVDARMAKRNLCTAQTDAPLVVALGPGFVAGQDCHAVIETQRGHNLGRVIWDGPATADTGQPGSVRGITGSRVLRAPADGHVEPQKTIGDLVQQGEVIATVAGQPVRASFDGVLRGLIHPRAVVTQGLKIGDVDPRARREHCFTISDKALAVGGGVVEAVLSSPQIQQVLLSD